MSESNIENAQEPTTEEPAVADGFSFLGDVSDTRGGFGWSADGAGGFYLP